jgi:hypothetical protein
MTFTSGSSFGRCFIISSFLEDHSNETPLFQLHASTCTQASVGIFSPNIHAYRREHLSRRPRVNAVAVALVMHPLAVVLVTRAPAANGRERIAKNPDQMAGKEGFGAVQVPGILPAVGLAVRAVQHDTSAVLLVCFPTRQLILSSSRTCKCVRGANHWPL